jgi:hypothetical protein
MACRAHFQKRAKIASQMRDFHAKMCYNILVETRRKPETDQGKTPIFAQ